MVVTTARAPLSELELPWAPEQPSELELPWALELPEPLRSAQRWLAGRRPQQEPLPRSQPLLDRPRSRPSCSSRG